VSRVVDRVAHLTTRFFGSITSRALPAADVAFVRATLTPDEFAIWERFGRADRAESVRVARRALEVLGDGAAGAVWIGAALLHDAGKVDAGLGTFGRAGATVVATFAGHERTRRWAREAQGARWQIGRYVAHDDLGAAVLRAGGSRPEVAEWAEVHHRPDRWQGGTIPLEVCTVLARADGERI
jgi:hypothetical protein